MMDYELQPSPRLRTSRNIFSGGVEENFSPVISFSTPGDLSVTYTRQLGRSFHIGSLVICFVHIVTSSFTYTTASSILLIKNIPYNSRVAFSGPGTVGIDGGSMVFAGITLAAGLTNIQPFVLTTGNQAGFTTYGSGTARGTLDVTNTTSGTNVSFIGTIMYIASDIS